MKTIIVKNNNIIINIRFLIYNCSATSITPANYLVYSIHWFTTLTTKTEFLLLKNNLIFLKFRIIINIRLISKNFVISSMFTYTYLTLIKKTTYGKTIKIFLQLLIDNIICSYSCYIKITVKHTKLLWSVDNVNEFWF